jgi:hypothetical protein
MVSEAPHSTRLSNSTRWFLRKKSDDLIHLIHLILRRFAGRRAAVAEELSRRPNAGGSASAPPFLWGFGTYTYASPPG